VTVITVTETAIPKRDHSDFQRDQRLSKGTGTKPGNCQIQTRPLRVETGQYQKFGRDKVHDQIERVITIMKLCNNMTDFREKFARVFKKSPAQLSLFDFDFSK
jgi:hypothetical protein